MLVQASDCEKGSVWRHARNTQIRERGGEEESWRHIHRPTRSLYTPATRFSDAVVVPCNRGFPSAHCDVLVAHIPYSLNTGDWEQNANAF